MGLYKYLKEKVFELEATVTELRQQAAEKAEPNNSSILYTPNSYNQISTHLIKKICSLGWEANFRRQNDSVIVRHNLK